MNGAPFSISGRPWIFLSEEARKERRLSDKSRCSRLRQPKHLGGCCDLAVRMEVVDEGIGEVLQEGARNGI